LPFDLDFRGQRLQSTLVSYNINEMLGTKMRALVTFLRLDSRTSFSKAMGRVSIEFDVERNRPRILMAAPARRHALPASGSLDR
jgi:hypothetical protein